VTLVAGVDSSTQSCKVVVLDAATGRLVREDRAAHPDGTEVDPAAWLAALSQAVARAGGFNDVAAVSIGGQQDGMVCLDENGCLLRPALLWNDTRSARAASQLIEELGGGSVGRQAWADAVGLVPVASFTVTKLRWLADAEPDNAARTAAVCLRMIGSRGSSPPPAGWRCSCPTAVTPAVPATGLQQRASTDATCSHAP
jgi:xylulokinase